MPEKNLDFVTEENLDQKDSVSWSTPSITIVEVAEITNNSCAGGDDGLGGGS